MAHRLLGRTFAVLRRAGCVVVVVAATNAAVGTGVVTLAVGSHVFRGAAARALQVVALLLVGLVVGLVGLMVVVVVAELLLAGVQDYWATVRGPRGLHALVIVEGPAVA